MPIRKQLFSILLICGLGCATSLLGGSSSVLLGGASYLVDNWDTDSGLPQNSVTAIAQTPDGYLWLGTLNGLVRFDGIRFAVFDENNTSGLKSSRIIGLFAEKSGGLFVQAETAEMGLLKDGMIRSLGFGSGTRIMSACEDAGGAAWFYGADGQLWRYQDGKTNRFLVGAERFSYSRALIRENDGRMWLGTDWGQVSIEPGTATGSDLPLQQSIRANKLEGLLASQKGGYWRIADGRIQKWNKNQVDEFAMTNYPWGEASVAAMCEDAQGNLIVGTRGAGLFWFDAEGHVSSLSTSNGLSHNWVLSLYVDREGTLWVGTDGGGLNRAKRQVFDVLEASLNKVVTSVATDNSGGVWIGFNGQGALYWKNGTAKQYGTNEGLPNLFVRAMHVDTSNQVWAGTGYGLVQLKDGKFQRVAGTFAVQRVVQAITQDRKGRLWFGTQDGLVSLEDQSWRVYTRRDGLSSENIRALIEDGAGNLWIGTQGGGLIQRDGEGKFVVYRKENSGLPSDNVSSMYVDSAGILWVGTDGGGLARYHNGKWTRYTTRDGLASNSISYLIEDDQGYFWIGSNAGLMRVQKAALNDFAEGGGWTAFVLYRAYKKSDGLPVGECTLGARPGRTADGKLLFPTIKGVGLVNPAALKPNTIEPPVIIESVLLDGQAQHSSGLMAGRLATLTIPASKERLEIQYTSLNLGAPDRARFKYMLEGHETEWIEAGDTRVARYSKLPPRHYTFKVTACNEDGVWNSTGSTLQLIVQPPFWRTWWFLGGTSLMLLGSIVGGVHYVSTKRLQRKVELMQQQEALEKERARIARDLHDQLGASLTQVALLGELAEGDKDLPQEVEGHARQITQTARETTRVLDEIVWAVNPSNDTLEGLINYICKYAQEYLAVAGVKYRLEVPSELPPLPIAPEVRHNVFLASKEAVTNVVRHAKASSAWLRLVLEGNRFTVEIADDGRGVGGMDPKAAMTRNGLKNMRKRMEEIGGEFSIGASPEGGALVRLVAPIGEK